MAPVRVLGEEAQLFQAIRRWGAVFEPVNKLFPRKEGTHMKKYLRYARYTLGLLSIIGFRIATN
jgi:hypothetical protein